jgi:hypothetical protein
LLSSIMRKSSISRFSRKPRLLSSITRIPATTNFVHVHQRVSQIRSKFHLPSMYQFSLTRNCSALLLIVLPNRNSYTTI